jgi:hypothetical protein
MDAMTEPAISDIDQTVRLAVYRHFIDHGSAPSLDTLAEQLEQPAEQIQQSLINLEAHRAFALTPGTDRLWMAHPFSAVPTAYPVKTATATYWANCAWDALSIAALLNQDATCRAQCPDCAEKLTLEVRNGQPVATSFVVHFAVPPRQFWDNVGFT